MTMQPAGTFKRTSESPNPCRERVHIYNGTYAECARDKGHEGPHNPFSNTAPEGVKDGLPSK